MGCLEYVVERERKRMTKGTEREHGATKMMANLTGSSLSGPKVKRAHGIYLKHCCCLTAGKEDWVARILAVCWQAL